MNNTFYGERDTLQRAMHFDGERMLFIIRVRQKCIKKKNEINNKVGSTSVTIE